MFHLAFFRITPSTTSTSCSLDRLVDPVVLLSTLLVWLIGSGLFASLCLVLSRSRACAIFSNSASRTASSILSFDPSPGRAGNVRGPLSPSSCCGDDCPLLSGESSVCRGDLDRGTIGVCPACSVFAAGNGDMIPRVGGGLSGGSSTYSLGGSEILVTIGGLFFRRRRRAGETSRSTSISKGLAGS
jgi:LPXTG-motif cell wall-anchored protein